MDTSKKELNINELEKVKGCGQISGFKKYVYVLPPRKKNADETESEQK